MVWHRKTNWCALSWGRPLPLPALLKLSIVLCVGLKPISPPSSLAHRLICIYKYIHACKKNKKDMNLKEMGGRVLLGDLEGGKGGEKDCNYITISKKKQTHKNPTLLLLPIWSRYKKEQGFVYSSETGWRMLDSGFCQFLTIYSLSLFSKKEQLHLARQDKWSVMTHINV